MSKTLIAYEHVMVALHAGSGGLAWMRCTCVDVLTLWWPCVVDVHVRALHSLPSSFNMSALYLCSSARLSSAAAVHAYGELKTDSYRAVEIHICHYLAFGYLH